MTNFIATVVAVLATNWVTVSRTVPIYHDPPNQMLTVMRYDTLNQSGTVVTNYVASIVWKGKTNLFVLESVEAAGAPRLSRSVPDADFSVR